MVTAKGHDTDKVEALEAGANDYITKPFSPPVLKARIGVATRVVGLQRELAHKVTELEAALLEVQVLHGLLPICSYCKKIRDDGDYWQQIEVYISERSDAEFSHGICPDCYETHMVPQLEASKAASGASHD
jgi:response regulator RpfG family c-di-GMP phosphodiesterase